MLGEGGQVHWIFGLGLLGKSSFFFFLRWWLNLGALEAKFLLLFLQILAGFSLGGGFSLIFFLALA